MADIHKMDVTAAVYRRGSAWVHRLLVDGAEAGRRTSRTRRYTHALARLTDDGQIVALSWHLKERAAYHAMAAHSYGRHRVVEVVEVPE